MPSPKVPLSVVVTTCQTQTVPITHPESTAWRVKILLASVRVAVLPAVAVLWVYIHVYDSLPHL